MKFDDGFIFKLKSMCDINLIISSYVEMKAVGANKRCCCPFHAEKTPSFFIYENTQSFYCFGCGVGGDVITFIEKIENLSYVEAVKFLADRVGLRLPDNDLNDEVLKKRKIILEINRIAAVYYNKNLKIKEGSVGRNYLHLRGIKSSTITYFGLGYALNSWNGLTNCLKHSGFSNQQILDSGLVLVSKSGVFYDRFRNRLVFPILNYRNDVVGFGGRLISGDGAKYINSSDSIVFKKSFELYGLNFLKSRRYSDELVLCEGYFDVVSLHQFGFFNCVATLGTSLTKNHALLLARFCKKVIIAYDSDSAGQAASKRAVSLLENVGLIVKVLKFKGAKDPDEFLNKFGAKRFKNLLNEAVDYDKLFFVHLIKKFKSVNVQQQPELLHEACEYVASIADEVKRDVYIRKICFDLNVSSSVLRRHVRRIIAKKVKKNKKVFSLDNVLVKSGVNSNNEKDFFSLNFQTNTKLQEFLLVFSFFYYERYHLLLQKVDESYFTTKFYRKVFSSFNLLLTKGVKLNLANMRMLLNDEEFGQFCRMINSSSFKLMNLEDEKFLKRFVERCIEKLRFVYFSKTGEFANMDVKDLENLRLNKAKAKR